MQRHIMGQMEASATDSSRTNAEGKRGHEHLFFKQTFVSIDSFAIRTATFGYMQNDTIQPAFGC